MKRTFFAVLAALMILTLSGCGNDYDGPWALTTSILSDPTYDGDIQQNADSGAFTVTQVDAQRLYAGIDPVSGDEYRAFLDFPLTGADGIPEDAIIESAYLDIFINDIEMRFSSNTIPLRIDLVSFQPPDLIWSDFDRPALESTTVRPPISRADFDRHVTIDVTSLMIEAQRRGLADFQVRIMEDFGIVTPGLIEINDTTGINRSTLAPLLKVRYF